MSDGNDVETDRKCWSHGTNEVQDLLEDLNASVNIALECLEGGDLVGVRTALKGVLDEIGQQLDDSDGDG